jgi:hypothetical protein
MAATALGRALAEAGELFLETDKLKDIEMLELSR